MEPATFVGGRLWRHHRQGLQLKLRPLVAKLPYGGFPHSIQQEREVVRRPFSQLYLHLVWATWNREPLLTSDIQPRVYAAIAKKCRRLKCEPLAIGGVEDHVHVLVRLHPTVSVAHLVKHLKGSTSHLVNHELRPDAFFRWQGAYSAFTVRRKDVPRLQAYIRRQAEHHASGRIEPMWEIESP